MRCMWRKTHGIASYATTATAKSWAPLANAIARAWEKASAAGRCNPMNLCFTSEGEVLVSESSGMVKRFTTSGQYVGTVGAAGVPEGCKNSAVGVSSNGDYVFYIDIRNSKILVLVVVAACSRKHGRKAGRLESLRPSTRQTIRSNHAPA